MSRLAPIYRRIADFFAAPKTIFAIAVAAMVAGALPILPGAQSEVVASAAAFSDRFIVEAAGPACSKRSWPYYETRCLRGPDGMQALPVRQVMPDRLPQPRN
jgi:hypothetical protein